MQPQIRAFIAVELPPEIKMALRNFLAKLKSPVGNSVKWVDPNNIHLTLKFLGNITSTQVEAVNSVMQSACRTTAPFQLQVHTPGAFPDFNRVQVIWVGLHGSLDSLIKLQKNLDAGLASLGFQPETRPFSPHLTLGRVRETATLIEKQNIGRSVSSSKIETGLIVPVQSLSLMQSRLMPDGPHYNCLKSVTLTQASN